MNRCLFLTGLLTGLMISFYSFSQNDTISVYPYYQNFENNLNGWTYSGDVSPVGENYWHLAKADFMALSGRKVLAHETPAIGYDSKIYSPVFDISNLNQLYFECSAFNYMGSNYGPGHVTISYSTNNGQTWTGLANITQDHLPWTKFDFTLDSLLPDSSIIFMFDGGFLSGNVLVDNFYVGESLPQEDLGINRILMPSGCMEPGFYNITIELANPGIMQFAYLEFETIFNNDSVAYDYFSGVITPGDTILYTLSNAIYIDSLINNNFMVSLVSAYNFNTFNDDAHYQNPYVGSHVQNLPWISGNMENWICYGLHDFNPETEGAYISIPHLNYRFYESPCFDFSNADLPVLSVEYFADFTTFQQADISLFYSENNGISYIPLYDLPLNTSPDLQAVEIALPELSSKNNIKFRIASSINYAYFGYDAQPVNFSIVDNTGLDTLVFGCTDSTAYNFDPQATFNNAGCEYAQTIELNYGWNLISTYIDPDVNDLDSIMEPVINSVLIIKDKYGQVYWAQYGIDMIDTLTIGDGYQIMMGAWAGLTIFGDVIEPQSTPISIAEGWNLIAYLRQSPANIIDVLSPVTDHVVICKNNNGQAYWPQFGINMIGLMEPGQGYQIKMDSSLLFTYEANDNSLNWSCGDPVSDIFGSSYSTIEIGNQCWMANNLNTGGKINSNTEQANNMVIEKYCYDNDILNCETYGGLYKWNEMMNYHNNGIQGICPFGWHIHTDAEWFELENFVEPGVNNPDETGFRGNYLGNNLLYQGGTGLDILFAGLTIDSSFFGISPTTFRYGFYASSSQFDSWNEWAWAREFHENNPGVRRDIYPKDYAMAVRCIKTGFENPCHPHPDTSFIHFEEVYIESNWTTIAANSPLIGTGLWEIIDGQSGIIADPNDSTSTLFGVVDESYTLVWSVSNECGNNTDTAIVHFVSCDDGDLCTDDFININIGCYHIPIIPSVANAGSNHALYGDSAFITATPPVIGVGLWSIASGTGGSFGNEWFAHTTFYGIPGETYLAVWTVYHNCDTTHDTISIELWDPTQFYCGNDLLDNRDGKLYKTVEVNNQCWMAENLNYGNYLSNTLSQTNNQLSERYCYNNDSSNCDIYGGLYSWDELMAYSNAQGSQGICPEGWHVPSDSEWFMLENFLDSTIANPFATGYRGINAGTRLKLNGSSGMDILLAGISLGSGSFSGNASSNYDYGVYATSTENSTGSLDAWIRLFGAQENGVNRYYYAKSYGISLRCTKD